MKENQQQQQKKKDAYVERREKAKKITAQQRVKAEKPVSVPEPLSVPSPSSSSRNQEAVPAETSQVSSTVVEEGKNNIASSPGKPDAWSSSKKEGASISFERFMIMWDRFGSNFPRFKCVTQIAESFNAILHAM